MTRILSLFLVLALSASACHPPPPPSQADGGIIQPRGWTDTARVVVTIANFAVPATRAIIVVLPLPPATANRVDTILRGIQEEMLPAFRRALDRFDESRGTDGRCDARAAAIAITTALIGVADALATAGLDLAPDLHLVIDGLGSIVDELLRGCEANSPDAGLRYGNGMNEHLRARPRPLRPFPDLSTAVHR